MLRKDLAERPWIARRWKHTAYNKCPFLLFLALLVLVGIGWMVLPQLTVERDVSRPPDPCQNAVDQVKKGKDWNFCFCRVPVPAHFVAESMFYNAHTVARFHLT